MINPYADAFGRRLRELRLAKGLNQKALADVVGINFTYLSKVETGTMAPPAEETIRKLAAALGADAEELILLAGKVPAELREIVTSKAVVPDLLRAIVASNMSDFQLQKLLEFVKSQ
jgi:transcriptional regulator with XRE-family HTH domain